MDGKTPDTTPPLSDSSETRATGADTTSVIPEKPVVATSGSLASPGYLSLIFTQFFGAANDNILKQCITFMVVDGIWAGPLNQGGLGDGGQVAPALLLTLPFIFLSGYAGQICDKYSKRTVMYWVKVAEVPIALLAFMGFYTHNLWLTLFSMLLLSIQSSFFGPAKYGVIPEIVGDEKLSMANGLINMLTNVAIILGALLAGYLSDLFNPAPVNDQPVPGIPWAPGVALAVVAIAGLVAIQFFPKVKPANPDLKFDYRPFAAYFESIRFMAQGPLLTIVLAWSGFYMVGMIAMLILPEYKTILDITYAQSSYFLGILGIAIAIGSVLTGWISGNTIRPWLIPMGACGMTISFLLLGLVPPTYFVVAVLVFTTGFSAGFYIVPLQALIQILSPDDERGRIIGTSAAISFCFTSIGPVLYWMAVNPLGMQANRVFLICAFFAAVGTAIGTLRLKKIMAIREQQGTDTA